MTLHIKELTQQLPPQQLPQQQQLSPPLSYTKLAITIAAFAAVIGNALDSLEKANNLNSYFLGGTAILTFALCIRWCIYAPAASWTLVYWLSPIFLVHYAWFAMQTVWVNRQTVGNWVWWSLKGYFLLIFFLCGGWVFYCGRAALKHCSAEQSKWNVKKETWLDGNMTIKWHHRETGQVIQVEHHQGLQKKLVRVVAKRVAKKKEV